MTTATHAPASSAFSTDPFYALGRADAYDESAHKPLEAITAHARTLLDHITPDTGIAQRLYTAGYARRAAELVAEHLSTVTTQTDRAHKVHSRKNGYGS